MAPNKSIYPGTLLQTRTYLIKDGFCEYQYQRIDHIRGYEFQLFLKNNSHQRIYRKLHFYHHIEIVVYANDDRNETIPYIISCICTKYDENLKRFVLSFENSLFEANNLDYLQRSLTRLYEVLTPKKVQGTQLVPEPPGR